MQVKTPSFAKASASVPNAFGTTAGKSAGNKP